MYFLDMLFSKTQLFLYFFLRKAHFALFSKRCFYKYINPLQCCFLNTEALILFIGGFAPSVG